jgi:hypothetical protein
MKTMGNAAAPPPWKGWTLKLSFDWIDILIITGIHAARINLMMPDVVHPPKNLN